MSQEPTVALPPAPPGWQWAEILVSSSGAARRADVWLSARFPHLSRSAVARQLRAGRILGLDRPIKPGTTLHEGERLAVCRPILTTQEPAPPLPAVLHEDARLIAFDKPAGMLVHPSGGRFVWSLISVARLARPGLALHLVHRLDRDTSGVLVLAKDPEANRVLKDAFRAQTTHKEYWAFCRGVPPWSSLLVDAPIGDDEASEVRIRMGVREGGQRARTRFHVLCRWRDRCLIEAHPRTGRTHQIRVHLEHCGHPLLGDRIYGHPDALFLHLREHGEDAWARRELGFARQALHARRLCLPHPDGGSIELQAPLPEDLAGLVRGSWDSAGAAAARAPATPGA